MRVKGEGGLMLGLELGLGLAVEAVAGRGGGLVVASSCDLRSLASAW